MLAFRPTTTGRRSSPRPPRSDSFQLPCSRRLTRKPPREEITRVAKLGFREANFLVNDVTIDMYLKPWDVFWDAAEETNIVVSYHVGGSLQSGTVRAAAEALKPDQRQMTFDMGLGNGATSFFNPFVNLFNFGTLERHPKLKFCLAESAIGWIPFVVQEMDYR